MIEGSQQVVAIGAGSLQSTAFGASTYVILVTASAACHIRVGSNPTAVATDFLVKAADPPLQIGVSPTQKIAVIQDVGAGSLYIVEVCA
jgi:hypothetical protein